MQLDISKKTSLLIAAYFLLVGVILFLLAYIGMYFNVALGQLNNPLLLWMVDHRNQTVVYIAKTITTLASPMVFVMMGIAAIVWGARKRELVRPSLFIGAMMMAAATSWSLKNLIMDVRPPLLNMVPMFEMDYSFPSGHTLSAFVLLLVLGYLIYSRKFTKAKFYTWISFAIVGAALMASTRLYLGYHWLTDVIASFGLGFVILSVIVLIDRAIMDKRTTLTDRS